MSRSKVASAGMRGKKVLGAALALVGLLAISGLDHRLETWLIVISPSWLSALTTSI